MLNPTALEIINGTLAIAGIIALFVIANYLLAKDSTERGRRSARAIGTFVLGETIVRSWIWLWRFQQNNGWDTTWMHVVPLPIIGGTISVIGIWCMLRVFTTRQLPIFTWPLALVMTVAIITWLAIYE